MFPSKIFRAVPCPEFPLCRYRSCLFSHELAQRELAKNSNVAASTCKKRKLESVDGEDATEFSHRGKIPATSSSKAPTSTQLSSPSSPVSHPPLKPPTLPAGLTTIARRTREKTLLKLFTEFTRIYTPLLLVLNSPSLDLPRTHALAQESKIYAKSTPKSYANSAANVFKRLQARSPTNGIDDVGIDGEYTPSIRSAQPASQDGNDGVEVPTATPMTTDRVEYSHVELSSKILSPFLVSFDTLKTMSYPFLSDTTPTTKKPSQDPALKLCTRCGKKFRLQPRPEMPPAAFTACTYHYGSLRSETSGGSKDKRHTCCSLVMGSLGCSRGPHVYKVDEFEDLHAIIPFIETASVAAATSSIPSPIATQSLSQSLPPSLSSQSLLPPPISIPQSLPAPESAHPVPVHLLSIDCEMSYSTGGLSLTRLSAVDSSGAVLIDVLVLPDESILDVNTRFSGITLADLGLDPDPSVSGILGDRLPRLPFTEAQTLLLNHITPDTILLGHGLENDLKALRIIHHKIIDTAAVFPHTRGLPFRLSLKHLARKFLGKHIQDLAVPVDGKAAAVGHDSVEDARTCLELMQFRIAKGPKWTMTYD